MRSVMPSAASSAGQSLTSFAPTSLGLGKRKTGMLEARQASPQVATMVAPTAKGADVARLGEEKDRDVEGAASDLPDRDHDHADRQGRGDGHEAFGLGERTHRGCVSYECICSTETSASSAESVRQCSAKR